MEDDENKVQKKKKKFHEKGNERKLIRHFDIY